MSRASKFPGAGKSGDTRASGSGPYKSPFGAQKASAKAATTGQAWAPGKDMGAPQYSSISRHQSTAKSRGPYKGPSFRSLSVSYKEMQKTNTSDISRPDARPTSAGTVRGKASKTGMTGLSALKARMRKIGR